MTRRIVRWIALVTALCALLLAGCSPTATEPAESPAQTDGQTGSEASSPAEDGAYTPDFSEKLTISSNVQNAEAVPGTALWDYFQEKFNVEMELIPMTVNERHEKARLWVSSGDMPDLMWMDLDESMFAEYANWVSQGMFQAYPAMAVSYTHLRAHETD